MKKLIVTIAALALSLGAFAQINFGVKVGGNLSSLSGVGDYYGQGDYDFGDLSSLKTTQAMQLGINAGVYAEYMVMPLFGVQVEANYSTQGVNVKQKVTLGTDDSANNKIQWKLNYINIPILAKLHLGALRAYVGPQLGFALGFNEVQTSTNTAEPGEESSDKQSYDEGYNTFDLSLVLGAQYKLTANIGVDARYNIGMTNLWPATDDMEGWGKNGVLQVGVFYEF